MFITIRHDSYGEISYDENFWSGKKAVFIGGKELVKERKNVFLYDTGDRVIRVTAKGSYWFGAHLEIEGNNVVISRKPTWYEILFSALIYGLMSAWGNSPYLCSIVPVVGGAVGGLIWGVMIVVNLWAMREMDSVPKKLAAWLGILVATFVLSFLAALVVLAGA